MDFNVISPVDNSVYATRRYASESEISNALEAATTASRIWKKTTIQERAALCRQFIDHFCSLQKELSEEITWQMGRPITQSPGEINGVKERATHMISIAEESLADIIIEDTPLQKRYMQRKPLGTVLVCAPWNFPYLTAINAIIPALMAGNTVILKHASQTPICAERLVACFLHIGLPPGVFQYLHMTHDDTEHMIKHGDIDHVVFTGSTHAGHTIYQHTVHRFIGCGLELGGKDPAFVCADADLEMTLDSLVDGAFFNSGQSCCGIERIYVQAPLYDDFVNGFVTRVNQYKLGNPTHSDTNLGPMVKAAASNIVYQQIDDALTKGAKALIDPSDFESAKAGTAYCAPQVLINVDHSMALMTEENFGPVAGIMKVNTEQEALDLMNDSRYGLTASIWTRDMDRAQLLGPQIDTGTVFMNRCDYLDPALAWTGVKDTGRGMSLSRLGFDQLTRVQSFHLRG
jgi:acyl-CoA reductase-like NAD-dependent aldehyde dehydrogenase